MSTAKLSSVLTKLAHFPLAGVCVFLCIHLDVILRVATIAKVGEETAIASIEDIHLWIGEPRVMLNVGRTILLSDVACHDRSSMCRILAMEDEKSLFWLRIFEEFVCQHLLIVIVESPIDVTSIVLVLESTINNHPLIVVVIVFSIQDRDKRVLGNAWDAIRLSFREEMR